MQRSDAPFNQRPLVVYLLPFWRDETERMTYESAVEDNPRVREETPLSYIKRVSEIVQAKYKGLA